MNDLLDVVIALLLLAGNAFFVGAEFSLISARRDRLEALVGQGKTRARTVIRASQELSLMLAGAQLGITICSILLGRVGEPAIAHLIEAPLDALSVPHGFLHPIGFAIALILVVALHILLGEMVPKNIALAGPERSAMLLVPVHLMFIRIAKPIIAVYNFIATLGLRLLRIEQKDELDATVSAGELATMFGESRDEGLIDAEEHERLTRALSTSTRTVSEVMIALDTVHSVPLTNDPVTGRRGTALGAIEAAVSDTGYSRFPVRAADDSFAGYLHVKDILNDVLNPGMTSRSIIGLDKLHALPPIAGDLPLDSATASLRRTSAHLGLVTDSAGTTVGIVALEDLVEEFVGTVRDETHHNELHK